MKRHLVFSFYIFDGWENNFANKVHLKYLEKYRDLYDDAEFIISCDDVNDTGLTSGFEKTIIGIGFINVKFKIVKNTLLREAKPFYDEIATKMDTFDGVVTWGHNKGITNLGIGEEALFNWLSILYFGSMGMMDECEMMFFQNYYGGEKYFYGAPLVEGDGENNLWVYGGSFFNMNPQSILKGMSRLGKKLPKLSNRAYSECFPGDIFGKERLGSHSDSYLYNNASNFYGYTRNDWNTVAEIIFGEEIDNLRKTKNEIWNVMKF